MAFEDLHTKYVGQEIDLPPAADLVAMLDDGETYESLAATFDCSAKTIAARVLRSGLRDRPVTPRPVADVLRFPDLPGAACANTRNPDAFFSYEDWETEQARNICRRCPAIRDCLAWALTHTEHGIWAGTTPDQRDALRRRHTTKEPA